MLAQAEAQMLLAALGADTAVQCPGCGAVIMKDGGDDTMMCGCEARPAGGTMEKAMLGGGCGHEFDFRTLGAAHEFQHRTLRCKS